MIISFLVISSVLIRKAESRENLSLSIISIYLSSLFIPFESSYDDYLVEKRMREFLSNLSLSWLNIGV